MSPPGSMAPTSVNGASRPKVGERGREGTVRFMLDPERERDEKGVVEEFFKTDEEEYEIDDQPRTSRR